MQNKPNPVSIRFSDEFEEKLYRLSKKYRPIRSDIQTIIEQLQGGNSIGDRITGMDAEYVILEIICKTQIKLLCREGHSGKLSSYSP